MKFDGCLVSRWYYSIKIPLNQAKWVNFQIFTVCTGKAFMYFRGDFFKPLHSTSSVHCREGCLKTQSSVAVSVPHNHFLHITRALSPVWSFPQDPAGADVFSKQRQERDFPLHALWWCLILLFVLQTNCCALCQGRVVREKLELQGFSCECDSISLSRVSAASWTFPLVIPWVKAWTNPWKRSTSPLISGWCLYLLLMSLHIQLGPWFISCLHSCVPWDFSLSWEHGRMVRRSNNGQKALWEGTEMSRRQFCHSHLHGWGEQGVRSGISEVLAFWCGTVGSEWDRG